MLTFANRSNFYFFYDTQRKTYIWLDCFTTRNREFSEASFLEIPNSTMPPKNFFADNSTCRAKPKYNSD